MANLVRRPWVPRVSEELVQQLADNVAGATSGELDAWLEGLVAENEVIHRLDCVNLDPAANTMNPRAEALLSSGLGSRPSLGYPGDKYEMGLEAIEQIEVIARRRSPDGETVANGESAHLGDLVARAWHAHDPAGLAGEVTEFRRRFTTLSFVR